MSRLIKPEEVLLTSVWRVLSLGTDNPIRPNPRARKNNGSQLTHKLEQFIVIFILAPSFAWDVSSPNIFMVLSLTPFKYLLKYQKGLPWLPWNESTLH